MSISENSRFIALSPENGSQFTEGQKVIFEVKPSISFLKGKDCYISLDLERDSDNASMAHPVQLAGAAGCIERMAKNRIQHRTGMLLRCCPVCWHERQAMIPSSSANGTMGSTP